MRLLGERFVICKQIGFTGPPLECQRLPSVCGHIRDHGNDNSVSSLWARI